MKRGVIYISAAAIVLMASVFFCFMWKKAPVPLLKGQKKPVCIQVRDGEKRIEDRYIYDRYEISSLLKNWEQVVAEQVDSYRKIPEDFRYEVLITYESGNVEELILNSPEYSVNDLKCYKTVEGDNNFAYIDRMMSRERIKIIDDAAEQQIEKIVIQDVNDGHVLEFTETTKMFEHLGTTDLAHVNALLETEMEEIDESERPEPMAAFGYEVTLYLKSGEKESFTIDTPETITKNQKHYRAIGGSDFYDIGTLMGRKEAIPVYDENPYTLTDRTVKIVIEDGRDNRNVLEITDEEEILSFLRTWYSARMEQTEKDEGTYERYFSVTLERENAYTGRYYSFMISSPTEVWRNKICYDMIRGDNLYDYICRLADENKDK